MEYLKLSSVLLIVDGVLTRHFPLHATEMVDLPLTGLIRKIQIAVLLVGIDYHNSLSIIVHIDGAISDFLVVHQLKHDVISDVIGFFKERL
jgi:hypothetical protein